MTPRELCSISSFMYSDTHPIATQHSFGSLEALTSSVSPFSASFRIRLQCLPESSSLTWMADDATAMQVIRCEQGRVEVQEVFGRQTRSRLAHLTVAGQHRGALAAARAHGPPAASLQHPHHQHHATGTGTCGPASCATCDDEV